MPQRRPVRRTEPAPTSPHWPSDLAYLQSELGWIELRGRRLALERRAESGPVRPHPLFGGHGEDEEELDPAMLAARIGRARRAERASRAAIDARLARQRSEGPSLALDRLAAAHGLDALERLTLLLAAAPCVARRFERIYGAIESEDQPALTVDAVFAFAELSFEERVRRRATFGPRGRLVEKDLVDVAYGTRHHAPKELLGTEITLRGRTLSYLLGDTGLGDELAELARVEEPLASFDRLVLPAADKERILRVVARQADVLSARAAWGLDDVIAYGRGTLLLFHGGPGTGKTMAAHAVAQQLGKRVLSVDIPTFTAHHEAGRFIPSLFREARLQNALLFFDECESLFESRTSGNSLMTILLTEIERFEGVAVLATNLPQKLDEALDRRILVRVRFPEPDREARAAIWRGLLPPGLPLAPGVDVGALAGRFELTGGYIKNAVLAAAARAVCEAGDEAPAVTQGMLEEAAEEQSRRDGGDDDELPEVPRVRLGDVMLAPPLRAAIEELVASARTRRTVLERWGLGAHLAHGKGIAALLHGAPGTGKTLTAQAIAGELGRPLLLGSVSALLSPWVGETERALAQLFRRAQRLGAVLFLDEADALLADREHPDAARHDVSATNVLLSQIERFDGVVLVATNLPGRLDGALGRRLAYRFDFRLPDAALRTKIWARLLVPTVPREGAIDLERLAQPALSGARIQNAVFKAAFRAASAGRGIAQADLERAAREELEADAPPGRRSVGFAAE
jgi:SpoVK/Ycf46/Vps4 family AAA+-type ATPase